jgi:hypothetical protein
MATKDWRYLGKNISGRYAWYNEKEKVRIEVSNEDGEWIVTKDLKDLPDNKFHTRNQAITKVRIYMRTH